LAIGKLSKLMLGLVLGFREPQGVLRVKCYPVFLKEVSEAPML
jgi:hypothetical protein